MPPPLPHGPLTMRDSQVMMVGGSRSSAAKIIVAVAALAVALSGGFVAGYAYRSQTQPHPVAPPPQPPPAVVQPASAPAPVESAVSAETPEKKSPAKRKGKRGRSKQKAGSP